MPSCMSSSDLLGKSKICRLTQTAIYNKMNATQTSEYLKSARTKLICDLDAAFRLKLSTSLIIIDPSGNGRRLLIDEVLYSYNLVYSSSRSHTVDKLAKSVTLPSHSSSSTLNTNGNAKDTSRNYVGVVNSELLETDWEALVDLAGQFLIRSEKRESSGYTKALEDLEFHFRQCRIEGRPAVVVLEGFHRFASKRQTLIYTLLDLMHKKDLLFIMIGVTGRADVQYILEKRVLSRLNAQFVYLDSPSAEDIAKDLYQKCILPLSDSVMSAESHGAQKQLREHRIKFNKGVVELFGEYSDSAQYLTDENDPAAARVDTTVEADLPRSPERSSIVPASTSSAAVSVVDLLSPSSSVHSTPSRRSVRIKQLESPSADTAEVRARVDPEAGAGASDVVDLTQDSSGSFSSPPRMSPRSSTKQTLPAEGSPSAPIAHVTAAVTASSRKKARIGDGSQSKPPLTVQQRSNGSLVPSDAMNITDFINRSKEQGRSMTLDDSSVDRAGTSVSPALTTVVRDGSLLPVIRVYKEWGYGIDDFMRTLQFTLMGLSEVSPFLTKEIFCESMAQQMPNTVAESMSALDEVELYLLAALCYLHLHEQTSDHFTVSVLITNYDRMTSSLKEKRVLKLHVVQATHSLCRKGFIQLFNNHSGVRCAADSGLTSITNQTIVFLAMSVQEVKKAFLNKHLKQNAISGLECRRVQPIIKIQERVRRLLENPTVANLYTAESSSALQATSSFL